MYGYHSQLVTFCFDGGWKEILPTLLPTRFLCFLKTNCKVSVVHWKTTELTGEETQEDNEKVICLGRMMA